MFNKKYSIVLIVLVFMLSLCAVSAVDTNVTDDIEINDVDEEPPSGDISDLSADEVLAASDSPSGNYTLSGNDVKMYYKGTANYEVVLSQGSTPVSGASILINSEWCSL